MKSALHSHPLRNSNTLQRRTSPLLAGLDEAGLAPLLDAITIQEGARGERLLEQGSAELRHFFVIEGVLKRVVTSAEGREMTLHFARERDIETCYEAWRQHSLVASLPMDEWCAFMERHPSVRAAFHDRVVQLGATIVEHAVALLLLDAPSRVNRFSFRHPELAQDLPQKDVASHLNLSAETLCRLARRQRAAVSA